MRMAILLGLTAIAVASPAAGQSPFETKVLAALNAARADPAAYAAGLRRFRVFFQGKVIRLPNDPVDHMTQEGVAPLDEAVTFLDGQAPLKPVTAASGLARAAAVHVVGQGPSGAIGHNSRDGAPFVDRIRAQGGGGALAEVISYGADDAEGVVRQLIIDDGVADRGHRRILFDPGLRLAGVACGAHAAYRTMCVIDFATTITAAPALK